MSYLKDIPLDILKIDRSFINEITEYSKNELVESIISMGINLKLEVIAEGVETEIQLARLKSYNCDLVQGMFLAKPLYEPDFIHYIEEQAITI